MKEAGKNVKR